MILLWAPVSRINQGKCNTTVTWTQVFHHNEHNNLDVKGEGKNLRLEGGVEMKKNDARLSEQPRVKMKIITYGWNYQRLAICWPGEDLGYSEWGGPWYFILFQKHNGMEKDFHLCFSYKFQTLCSEIEKIPLVSPKSGTWWLVPGWFFVYSLWCCFSLLSLLNTHVHP